MRQQLGSTRHLRNPSQTLPFLLPARCPPCLLTQKVDRACAADDSRSPINSVDTLSCPILLLQGDEDKIVPPNQAETMHKALLAKGLPTALKIYEGEQHGFRKAENIENALNSELYFFSRVFGFECAGDDIEPFDIDNM